jgi:cytochrome c551/c552
VKNGRLLRVSYSTSFNQQDDKGVDQRLIGMNPKLPGTKFLPSSICLSCHSAQDKVIGPTFAEIAAKYKDDPAAEANLVQKVKTGGVGVWGQQPMPPHAELYNDKQIKEMIAAILATKAEKGHQK